MNLTALQRKLERLAVLMEIRADREEKKREEERENELKLLLLALLLTLYRDQNYQVFQAAFLDALRSGMEQLDPNGEYGDLIERELLEQDKYLQGFVNDLRNGKLSEGQARQRAGLYASSLGKVKWQMTLDDAGSAEMQWVYSPTVQDHCAGCIELNGMIKPASVWLATIYPRSGDTQCQMNCQCELEPV